MRPQSIDTRTRCQLRQQAALAAIELNREKQGLGLCVFETFDGPILNETTIHTDYDNRLSALTAKYVLVNGRLPLHRRILRFVKHCW